MYVTAIVLFVLTLLLSAAGGALIPVYFATPPGGDAGIAYALGMILVIMAVPPGVVASVFFAVKRKDETPQTRLLLRRPWLPLCAPVLVGIGLNLMLLTR